MSPRDIKAIEATLRQIFDFYGSSVSGAVLKSAKFQKLALDADLVDERLTSAKIDLIFKKVCGQTQPMTFPSFMDAIVLLAAEKYPYLLPQQATLRIFDEHFSTFSNPKKDIFDMLENKFFESIDMFRPQLQQLYEQYFRAEFATNGVIAQSTLASQSLRAFGTLLGDFEITPFLLSKASVFATYREVARFKNVPERVLNYLGIERSASETGGGFTFPHFVCALAHIAKKLFPHKHYSHSPRNTSEAFVQLLERMDTANPSKAIFFVDVGSNNRRMRSQRSVRRSARESGALLQTQDHSRSISGGRFSQTVPSSGGGKFDFGDSVPSRSSMSTSKSHSRSVRWSETGPASIPTFHERLVSQLFGYYAALGSPLNRTYMSTIKWNRFLRDAKLVAAEPSSSSRPGSTTETQQKRFSVSASCDFDSPGRPPLSQIDADLAFLQAQGQNARHHMSLATFEMALLGVAEKLYGRHPDALKIFCDDVLQPLSARLLEVHGEDVARCAMSMAEPEMIDLFARALEGLSKLFQLYAKNDIPDVWSAENFAKFCNDFEITHELSHLPLQRIFSDCVHVEYSSGQGNLGEMSLLSFQLALVMIATKVTKEEMPLVRKVALFFHRLNSVGMSSGIGHRNSFLTVKQSFPSEHLQQQQQFHQRGSSINRATLKWTNLMAQTA